MVTAVAADATASTKANIGAVMAAGGGNRVTPSIFVVKSSDGRVGRVRLPLKSGVL